MKFLVFKDLNISAALLIFKSKIIKIWAPTNITKISCKENNLIKVRLNYSTLFPKFKVYKVSQINISESIVLESIQNECNAKKQYQDPLSSLIIGTIKFNLYEFSICLKISEILTAMFIKLRLYKMVKLYVNLTNRITYYFSNFTGEYSKSLKSIFSFTLFFSFYLFLITGNLSSIIRYSNFD